MPITALQGLPPGFETALQLALEPVVTELRNALLQKFLNLVLANEPQDESFRLRADALVEALLADLGTSLPESVVKGLRVSSDRQAHAQQEALTQVLLAAGSAGNPRPASVGA